MLMNRENQQSSTCTRRNNSATTLFSVRLRLWVFFKPLSTHIKYCFVFSFKNMCENDAVQILLILGYFRICVVSQCYFSICWFYRPVQGTGIDGVTKNNAIFVLFNTKEFHKMVALIKIKIVIFQTSLRLYYWLFKQIETSELLYYICCLK
jgi:hypothetical protein